MVLHGVRGWGSAIAEGVLCLAGLQYRFVDVEGFDRPGAARDRLLALNPLAQVPVLVLDDGTVLTETAAITLYCADRAPAVAPEPGTAERTRFLRLLIWLVANVYPTFTYGDYPQRWTASGAAELVATTDAYRQTLYRWLETQLGAPWVLGERLSALDVYLAVLAGWRPRQAWFAAETPKLAAIAARAAAHPSLAAALAQRTLPG